MKLADLVAYRNLLESPAFDPEHKELMAKMEAILHTVYNHPVQFPICNTDIGLRAKNIRKALKDFRGELDTLRNEVNTLILRQGKAAYQRSLQWFEQEAVMEENQYVLNRRMSLDPAAREKLIGRIRQLNDWRLPAMIIHPGLEDFIQNMVGFDPLYVVDRNQDLIKASVGQFSDLYQTRLRQYVINDHVDLNTEFMTRLPDGQFALIFAYNYFNFVPMQVICCYLRELWKKMRDGGSLIFTYNDCDREEGAGAAESGFMCYTPASRIKDEAGAVGFEISLDERCTNGNSWLELRKPGRLRTARGSQVVARILKNT